MMTNAAPESGKDYFESFAAYLQSGDTRHLTMLFPQAENHAVAVVYRNGFLRASIDALRNSYPVVVLLVGDEYFDFLAKTYVGQHPPKRGTFIGYGEYFPEFLQQNIEQHKLGYLADFARLDQAWLHAYFARDSRLLCKQDIELWQNAGHAIENLSPCFPESVQLITLQHQVCETWLVLKSADSLPDNTRIEAQIEHLLVWRDAADQVRVRALQVAERAFILTLQIGTTTIAQAAGCALELDNTFPILNFFSELLDTDLLAVK
jgi:hypothetical protein